MTNGFFLMTNDFFLLQLLFNNIKHFHSSLNCCGSLVGVEATGAELVFPLPCNNCLNKGVGFTTWRNGYRVINQQRERLPQTPVYLFNYIHEGIVLTVAMRGIFIDFIVDFNSCRCDWFQPIS